MGFTNLKENAENREGAVLGDILSYKNKNVVDSFMEAFDVTSEEAHLIFRETLRFFWVCRECPSVAVIDAPLRIIDEMWHIFILYMKDYRDFCRNYIGRQIVHTPTPPSEKKIKQEPEERKIDLYSKKERYIEIYKLIGREYFLLWFDYFQVKYTKEHIHALRKK